jgi:dienelactone hydrolase
MRRWFADVFDVDDETTMHTTALLLTLLAATPAPASIWSTFPPVRAGAPTTATAKSTAPEPAAAAATATPTPCPDDDEWVTTTQPASCVHVVTHRPRRTPRAGAATLVVYLHADLYPVVLDSSVVRWMASEAPEAVVVSMLRPGSRDADGHETKAVARHGFGDAYLREDALVVGAAITALKEKHQARRVVVVGLSGGAAIAANVAGLFAGLVDDAVVAACPCDLAAWREHRATTSRSEAWRAEWRAPFRSLSPVTMASHVASTTRVTLVAGARDRNTPPTIHEGYQAALHAAGVDATLAIVDDTGHGVLDSPRARALLSDVLARSTHIAHASDAGVRKAPLHQTTSLATAVSGHRRAGLRSPSVRDAP